MTKRLPADPAPGPLLPAHSKIMPPTSTAFSPLSLSVGPSAATSKGSAAIRRAQQGPHCPGQHRARGRRGTTQGSTGTAQWFLFRRFFSESSWNPEELNRHRMDL